MNEYEQFRRFSEVAGRVRPSQLPTDHLGWVRWVLANSAALTPKSKARLASDRRPNQVIEHLAVQAKYAGIAWLLMDGAEGDSLPEELALCVAAQAKALRFVPCPRPRYRGPRCTAPSNLPLCNSSTPGGGTPRG